MRITCTSFPAIAALLSMVACSSPQPEPAPAPSPPIVQTPPPPPPPPQSSDWTIWPIAPGTWVYREDDRGSLALFGPRNDDALLTIRCAKNERRIYISRAGLTSAGATTTLRASSGLQSFETRGTGGGLPHYTSIAMAPTDYILDRIAFSRGRFAVETTGMRGIAIPIWPEFTRVVEDCRN